VDKLESFELSPNEGHHRVACFVRGSKGAPSSVRIFQYPKFALDDVLASKSFFKADSVSEGFQWLVATLLLYASDLSPRLLLPNTDCPFETVALPNCCSYISIWCCVKFADHSLSGSSLKFIAFAPYNSSVQKTFHLSVYSGVPER